MLKMYNSDGSIKPSSNKGEVFNYKINSVDWRGLLHSAAPHELADKIVFTSNTIKNNSPYLNIIAYDSSFLGQLLENAESTITTDNMLIEVFDGKDSTKARYIKITKAENITSETEVLLLGSKEASENNNVFVTDSVYKFGTYESYSGCKIVLYTSNGIIESANIFTNPVDIQPGTVIYGLSLIISSNLSYKGIYFVFAPEDKTIIFSSQKYKNLIFKEGNQLEYSYKKKCLIDSNGTAVTINDEDYNAFNKLKYLNNVMICSANLYIAKYELYGEYMTDNSYIYNPDVYGAVGDGETYDDAFFPSSKLTYDLSSGKTYRISENKVAELKDCKIIGKGKIKYIKSLKRYNKGGISGDKQFGTTMYEISNYSPKNRFEECALAYTSSNNWHSDYLKRRFKQQASALPKDSYGEYHSIAAAFLAYDCLDKLPEQFTFCIGRCVTWERKKNGPWIKTTDNVAPSKIANYRLPWNNNYARYFSNEPKFIDDHTEIIINKNELTSWQGDKGLEDAKGSCIHFWSSQRLVEPDDMYDDIVTVWEIWVKEPEAADCLYVEVGTDTTSRHPKNNYDASIWTQPIIMPSMPINNKRQLFWGATMDIDECRNIDSSIFEFDLRNSINQDNFDKLNKCLVMTEDEGRNFNLLKQEAFSREDTNYSLSYNDGIYSLIVVAETPAWDNIPLKMIDFSNLNIGEKYNLNIEILEGDNSYIGTLYHVGRVDSKNSIQLQLKGATKIDDNTYTIPFIYDVDGSVPNMGTNRKSNVKFRMWITKDGFQPYQPYGQKVSGIILDKTVRVPYLEDKINEIVLGSASSINITKEEALAILRGE